MGLFDKRVTVEELLQERVSDLSARLQLAETLLVEERKQYRADWEKWRVMEQDFIETICILKGIPVPHHEEDKGPPSETAERPTVLHGRHSWSQVLGLKTRRSIAAVEQSRALVAQRR